MSSVNPSNPANEAASPSYKEQLDRYADEVKHPATSRSASEEGGVVKQAVDKVSQYVPATVSKVLGGGGEQNKSEATAEPQIGNNSSNVCGPPDRPHHDTQIEEFVRDQHRSKKDDVLLGRE